MKTRKYILMMALCAGFASCTSENTIDEPSVVSDSVIKEIFVTIPEISVPTSTRTAFEMSDEGVNVTWAEGDVIGIFPSNGGQVEFPTSVGAGSNVAKFDGGGWGLKDSYSYAAYFPYDRNNVYRDNTSILLDYTGQTQTGNGNADHLGAYDYLASGTVTPVGGYLNLNLKRLGTLVRLDLTIPEPAECSSIVLSSDVPFITKAHLNISGSEPEVNAVETSNALVITLKDIVTTEENEVITVYCMLPPTDVTDQKIGVGIQTKSYMPNDDFVWASYASSLEPKNMEAGRAYRLTASDMYQSGISFEDDLVRELCVANWDINRDGVLSFYEARQIEDFGQVFRETAIRNFCEIFYFTGLTTISDYAFYGCTNLTNKGRYNYEEEMRLPESVERIGGYAFANCENLGYLLLPDALSEIGDGAFENCSRLARIDIPEGVTEIGYHAFYECYSLSEVGLPEGLTRIGYEAFHGCNSLSEIAIPAATLTIEGRAFRDCNNLKSFAFPEGTTRLWGGVLENCRNLKSVYIPESVTVIEGFILNQSDRVQSVTIPANVTEIYNCAFCGMRSLEYVKMLAETPPTLALGDFHPWTNDLNGYVHFLDSNECPIYVPTGSVDAYRSAEGWVEYADRIKPMEEADGEVTTPGMGGWN